MNKNMRLTYIVFNVLCVIAFGWSRSAEVFSQSPEKLLGANSIVPEAKRLIRSLDEKLEELEKLSKNFDKVKNVGNANIALEQLMRDAQILAATGEPVAFDYYFRGLEFRKRLMNIGRSFQSKYQNAAVGEKRKKAAFRSKTLKKVGELLGKGNSEKAELEIRKVLDDSNAYRLFMKQGYQIELTREYGQLSKRVLTAVRAKQMPISNDAILTFGDSISLDESEFISKAKTAIREISSGNQSSAFGDSVSQSQLIDKIALRWREFENRKAKKVASEWLASSYKLDISDPDERSDEFVSLSYSKFESTELEQLLIDACFCKQGLEANQQIRLLEKVQKTMLALMPSKRLSEVWPILERRFNDSIDRGLQIRYRSATSEMVRWRRLIAGKTIKLVQQQNAASRKLAERKKKALPGYAPGLLRDTLETYSFLNASMPATRNTLKKTFVGQTVSSPVYFYSDRVILRPFLQKANIAARTNCSAFIEEMNVDLLISDEALPPSFDVMRSLYSTTSGVICGKVRNANLWSNINAALGVGPFKQIPSSDKSAFNSLRLSFSLDPVWFRHDLFFVRFK